jgi:subtilisin family serine protease
MLLDYILFVKCAKKVFILIFIIINFLSLLNIITCQNYLSNSNLNKRQYSNQWVLTLNGDIEQAKKLANDNNFRLLRQIGFTNNYVVELDHHRVRRSIKSSDPINNKSIDDLILELEKKISSNKDVESFGREKLLKRIKRDFIENFDNIRKKRSDFSEDTSNKNQLSNKNEDPYWSDMWYLNRHLSSNLPDMNVTAAWALGYSGRGVSVTFLDDGLEWDHPDIQQNYDSKASCDINGNDGDPMPRYDETNENKHGTRCAGEVAAVANNSICSVGVAFNAGIGGIRMLDGDVTDSVEASSLSYNSDHIAIYSASWGPDDNGEVVDGPGPLAKKAFSDGVSLGRSGLGSIFVWASGNGGRFNDSCACDGYANSIYTLSISSTSENSEKPWYLEECTSTLATTYSSGDERLGEHANQQNNI